MNATRVPPQCPINTTRHATPHHANTSSCTLPRKKMLKVQKRLWYFFSTTNTIYYKKLEGMWVCRVSGGLYCGQPAPRTLPWLAKSHNPAMAPTFSTRHTEAWWISGRRDRGCGGRGNAKNNHFQPVHANATATKNCSVWYSWLCRANNVPCELKISPTHH